MKDFAVLIKELTGSNSTIQILPVKNLLYLIYSEAFIFPYTTKYQKATKDDPRQRKPDITTAGEQLGWKPMVYLLLSLIDGTFI